MPQFVQRQHIRALALCAIILVLPGGGSPDPQLLRPENPETSRKAVQCPEPRPQICTQEYNPVCARLRDGAKRTYASGCMACSDANVTGFWPDRCE